MAKNPRLGGGRRWALAGLVFLLGQTAPRTADAFLVLAKGASRERVSSDAVTVVALREGDHTVLSIEARVRGPSTEIALLAVSPPSASAVTTLRLGSLEPALRVTGPRLAEYWEQDPCEFHDVPFASDGTFDAAPGGAAAPVTADAAPEFTTEVLAAKSGAEIAAALKHDGYGVPDALAAVLDGYLKAGSSVVIARLDTSKLPRRADAVVLPPLQIHYQSSDFTLPTRLFAVGAQGAAGADGGASGAKRELSVDVLSSAGRYEAANQPNLAVPTNLNVDDAIRSTLPTFYRSLLDRAFDNSPTAVLTEYAWRASTCEVCAAPLSGKDLGAFGGALLPSAAAGKQGEVLIEASTVASRPDGPAEVRSALMDCYGKALGHHPGLAGEVAVVVEVGGDGSITSATPSVAGQPDDALVKCAVESARSSKQWRAGSKGSIAVTFAPFSRAFLAGLVVTTLRGRYGRVPDRDLTLVPGRAIEGGREMGSEGSAPARVYPAQASNDFQARYVIRHPFAGPIQCATPTRGVWGGSPPDGGRVTDRPRQSDGGGLADGGTVDFEAFAIHFGPPPAKEPAPTTVVASAPVPSGDTPPGAPATTSPPPRADCGACSVGARSGNAASVLWAALGALALLAGRRRHR